MKTHIIIGASAAGVGCANTLRRLDPDANIIMIAREKEWPYNKCFLADYLSGDIGQEKVQLLTKEQIEQKNIQLSLDTSVVAIDSASKSIELADGKKLNYDTLFLGVGARAAVPPIAGADVPGVFTFQTLYDTDTILAYVKNHQVKRAIVIGAGLTGLECADALSCHGVNVAVIEQKDRVLAAQINHAGSGVIEQYMQARDIGFYSQETVTEIVGDATGVYRVQLLSGGRLDADMVVFAVGVRPNSELAERAGVELYKNGVDTDEYMQTNIPDIYAGGDVAMITDVLTGKRVLSATWPDAMMQGGVAAHAMAGKPKKYPGACVITSTAFFGIKFATCGPVVDSPEMYEIVVQKGDGWHHTFLLGENERLCGFSLVGNIQHFGKLRRALLTKSPIDRVLLKSKNS